METEGVLPCDDGERLASDQMLTIGTKRFAPKSARFRECACRQSTVQRVLANRIVHNRFWHENAWP